MPTMEFLLGYWVADTLAVNGAIVLNLIGALLLGLLVGFEHSYHGRAAGMRTYGLVCMGSAALVALSGYPGFWFGAHNLAFGGADPTRIIQGIVTGIGFLGAGVILREGFSISGLATAASIWVSAVVGILVGVGFYMAAMGLAFLCAMAMIFVARLEAWLPSRHAVAITVRFKPEVVPSEKMLRSFVLARGYEIAGRSLAIGSEQGVQEWRFIAIALNKSSGAALSDVAAGLSAFDGIASFQLSHAKN